MKQYLTRKIFIYFLTFLFAVTIDWLIPRLMPGNPILVLVGRFATLPESAKIMYSYLTEAFGLDKPLWQQYLNFWRAFLQGDLGISIYLYPQPVIKIIMRAIPFSLGLLIPAILTSWFIGNSIGALAARNKKLDSIMLPVMYFITGAPYAWFGLILAYFFGMVLGWFPISGGYSFGMRPHLSLTFIFSLLKHWFLPYISLVIIQLGGWAIGMRNMVIYELEANYSRYLETLGVKNNLIRRYAFRNAILPQVTGLALQLGTIIAGQVTTEVVFSYPGIGYTLAQAILNQDYFLIQGAFLFIIFGVLLANFFVDIVYMILDPRIRFSYGGEVS